ncbi:MAG: hypothetical protein IJR89_02850 [Clostridia bacterium]|nr:hypothetical protein [Clostridia bacterium]
MKIKKIKPTRLYGRAKNPNRKKIVLRVLIVLGVVAVTVTATAAYGHHLLEKARESAAETADPVVTDPILPAGPASATGVSLSAYPLSVSSLTDIWAAETAINRLPDGTEDAVLYLFREEKAPLWKTADLRAPIPLYENGAALTAAELTDLAARKGVRMTALADAPSLSAELTEEESDAAAAYERMYLADLVRGGFTRFLLRLPDVTEENADRIVRYAGAMRASGENLTVGAVLTPAITGEAKPELLLSRLCGAFDYLALDLTEAFDADLAADPALLTPSEDGSASAAASFPALAAKADGMLELFSRYEMTLILRLPEGVTARDAAALLVPFLQSKALDSFVLYTEN